MTPGSRARAGWALALLAAAVTAPPAAAQETEGMIASPEPGWPQWRGPRRDGISGEKGLLQSWPEEGPKLLWKTAALGRGWSSPIVVGERLYVTGDEGDDMALYAFDLEGGLRWRATNGLSWKGPYPGARACFAFSEGRLYHMNAHGRVACLEASSGTELWAINVLERFEGKNISWAMSECLLVDGPRLIVTPGGRKALMAALDKSDGRTLWATEPLEGELATYSSPILFRHAGRRLLASCSSSRGFGVDADTGKLLWTVPLENRFGVNASTPAFGGGRVHYATAYFDGGCYRLAEDGRAEFAWTTPLDTCTGSFVLVDGVLYGGGYKKFRSWIGVDWASGGTRGALKELTTGAAIYADGRLHCITDDGQAALVTPVSGGFRIAGRFRLVPEKVKDAWAHPVLLDGRLYLRYHDTLWCYDVRAR